MVLIAWWRALLQDDTALILPATLAHEIAHQALGHPGRRILRLLTHLQCAGLAFGVLAMALHAPWPLILVTAVVTVAARLCLDRTYCHDELAADLHAVTLLDRAGIPGRRAIGATLAEDAAAEPRWHALTGWIFTGHPTVSARLRNLRQGR
ncbi:M48 family metalloprotease [Sphaerisporangium rhizosphaerae]|uniref:M48 family metalloprotease n=1 Tax=Sphaerisporangium rhizosphaerae TaxID=2269375 RepID=A0ABW2NXS8_9ACTN